MGKFESEVTNLASPRLGSPARLETTALSPAASSCAGVIRAAGGDGSCTPPGAASLPSPGWLPPWSAWPRVMGIPGSGHYRGVLGFFLCADSPASMEELPGQTVAPTVLGFLAGSSLLCLVLG